MTAIRPQDYDDQQIEEGQASLDAYESMAPLDHPFIVETPAETTIGAARDAIQLLVYLIAEVQEGKQPTCTLHEIAQAMLGKVAA